MDESFCVAEMVSADSSMLFRYVFSEVAQFGC